MSVGAGPWERAAMASTALLLLTGKTGHTHVWCEQTGLQLSSAVLFIKYNVFVALLSTITKRVCIANLFFLRCKKKVSLHLSNKSRGKSIIKLFLSTQRTMSMFVKKERNSANIILYQKNLFYIRYKKNCIQKCCLKIQNSQIKIRNFDRRNPW